MYMYFRMDLVEVRGKSTRGIRKVFILLTPDMSEAIEYLLHTRVKVGISTSNPYVFARKGQSQTPIDGCKAMRDVTEGCPGLQLQKTIRSTKLRKYPATTLQVSISVFLNFGKMTKFLTNLKQSTGLRNVYCIVIVQCTFYLLECVPG